MVVRCEQKRVFARQLNRLTCSTVYFHFDLPIGVFVMKSMRDYIPQKQYLKPWRHFSL